jgi:cytochrome c peroxidase
MRKFKTPTLRGLVRTAPQIHDGRFATLRAVVDHYCFPPTGPDTLEISSLDIDDAEALVAFLKTLDGGVEGALDPARNAFAGDRIAVEGVGSN